ncbi:hypothetical protein BGAFAR04_Ab0069 (plasmid) [Borreliella garinii Far04]|nr:hypothetical protein BGAFAR04_Ab0069 [Borreliella garinii Far04]
MYTSDFFTYVSLYLLAFSIKFFKSSSIVFFYSFVRIYFLILSCFLILDYLCFRD